LRRRFAYFARKLWSTRSRNEINIYNQSKIVKFFTYYRVGKWPEVEPYITIDYFVLKWFYFLCDGIYPKVKHYFNSMVGEIAKEKLFAWQQEAFRKAVERVFAVLFSRFNITYQPPQLFD
jgi:Plant transposon protein